MTGAHAPQAYDRDKLVELTGLSPDETDRRLAAAEQKGPA